MTDRNSSGRGTERVRVRSGQGRTVSSRRWLERQLNDPYVHAAKKKGYRSRAAFKLVELDTRFHFLKKGARIIDLGAAPGGWSQVAADIVGPTGRIIAIDILEMEPLPGVQIFHADLTDPGIPAQLKEALGGPADVVLSDMAASTTGHRATDHIRTTALLEAGLDLAEDVLKPGVSLSARRSRAAPRAICSAASRNSSATSNTSNHPHRVRNWWSCISSRRDLKAAHKRVILE